MSTNVARPAVLIELRYARRFSRRRAPFGVRMAVWAAVTILMALLCRGGIQWWQGVPW